MSKRWKKNKILVGKDGCHRTEILLYGEVLERLKCIQGLKMFYKLTWKNSIVNHFLDFKKKKKNN